MPKENHTIRFDDLTWELVQILSSKNDISVSDLLSELIWYHSMVEGDRPITTKIREMEPERREVILKQLIESAKKGEVIRFQVFKEMVKEAAKEYAKGIEGNVADKILFDLEHGRDCDSDKS